MLGSSRTSIPEANEPTTALRGPVLIDTLAGALQGASRAAGPSPGFNPGMKRAAAVRPTRL